MATAQPSPARLAANLANSRRSTGPRSAAGKARSRTNAIKHGLCGTGLAVRGEDAARIEAETLQAQEEFAPTTLAGMKLVRDIAAIWVRQDRCRDREAALLDRRARTAAADFDRARADRADALIDAIEANPRAHRRALLLIPEGIDRLLDALAVLLGDLAAPVPTWSPTHHQRLDALLGFRPDDLPRHRPTRYSRAVLGDLSSIAAVEVAGIDPADYQDWAMARLVEVIEAEVATLIAHGGTIDLAELAADRALAVRMARFDPGPDGALIRRYESSAARDLSRALRDLDHVESRHGTDPDAPDDLADETIPTVTADRDPSPIPNPLPDQPVAAELGSFGQIAPAAAELGSFRETPPAATPIAAPAAANHALRPVHTAEPTVFYPRIE